jgi:hypothetical protein
VSKHPAGRRREENLELGGQHQAWASLARSSCSASTASSLACRTARVGGTGSFPSNNGYHGAGDHIRTPYRGRNKPASQKEANRAHAQLRSPGERANAQLKNWHILRKLRCCPLESRPAH